MNHFEAPMVGLAVGVTLAFYIIAVVERFDPYVRESQRKKNTHTMSLRSFTDKPQIRITSEGGTARVYIDGVEVTMIRKLEFTAEAGRIPVLKLELFAFNAALDDEGAHVQQVAICAHCKQDLAEQEIRARRILEEAQETRT